MRMPRQLAGMWKSFERHWRLRPVVGHKRDDCPLVVRPLEDRRVLSAAVAAALVPPGAEGGIGGGGASPEASGMALANSGSSQPADAQSSPQVTDAQQTTAAKLTDSTSGEQSAGSLTADVSTNVDTGAASAATASPTVDESDIGAPVLTVAPNQTVDEGTELSITNIGQFTAGGLEVGNPSENFTYTIDWGDGRPVDTGTATIDQPGSPGVPTLGSFDGAHTYADNGDYTVTVTLSDGQGHVVSDTLTVTVFNVAPSLTVASDQTVDEGTQLSITNIGQFTDPAFNNPLNVGGETTEKFTYAIDWGDGTTVDSGMPNINVAGSVGVPTQGSFDGAHTYADNGIYTVTVTVSDDDGGTTSESFTVTVNNVAPTLTVAPNQTVDEGTQLSITNIGQFTDPAFNNPLNVGGETSEKLTYAIDWGDGTQADSGSPTIDVLGSPGVLTQGSFDGAHTYADNGVYTVTVTVSDDDGGSTSATFTVTVNNVAPTLTVAPDQTVNEGTQLSITNIGQFTDPGYDNPQNPGGATSETFTYSIDWGDGRPVDSGVATIDVPGSPGVPTQGSFDGAHTYADNGIYTVTVTVMDDDGGTAVETLTVTVENVAPSLTVAPNQTVDEGAQLSITNIGQFTDPGFNNPLNVGGETTEKFTYAIDWGDGTTVDSGAPNVNVLGSPGVLTQGSFDGAHTYGDNGVYTVTVTVSDDDGGSASASLTVTVGNVAPTLTVPPNQTVNEGTELAITNIGQFTDPAASSSETFTYSIDWGDGRPIDTGVATIDVPGSPGVPTQGSFDGAHTYADNGVYTVTVTVADDDGGVTSQTFQVTVNNVAPSLTVAPNQTVDEGTPLSITNIGQFTDPGFNNPLNIGGETSEKFTYSINWGDGSPVDSGVPNTNVFGSPGVLTQGSFDGAHTYGDNGVYTVTVTVSDDDGGTASATFTVTVNNVAPTLTVPPNQTVNEGTELAITNIGQFTDPAASPGETFTYSIDWGDGRPIDTGVATIDVPGSPGVPTQGSFDGAHTYADNGIYTVTVTVMDDDGGATSQTFEVTVNNVAPTLVVAPNQTVNQGDLLTVTPIGQFTDPGFDNPLNVGGETTERFTFAIDWGDGTVVDSGPGNITTPGGVGVLTAGSFNGSHTYTAAGVYTVTVTLSDDDGGSATGTFLVTVASVKPILIAGPDQTVNEGSQLSITDIGKFSDPSPVAGQPYTFSINWGDGLPIDTGVATVDVAGSREHPALGSFDGAHTYADNGVYTVTVSILTADGRTATSTLHVTVNNVAPTITSVNPDVTVPQAQPISFQDIVKFTDPGFDNPLNVGGQTVERFTVTINWGDGSPTTVVPGIITTEGHVGLLTSATADATHVFAAGTVTVTMTVRDDDGGVATATFNVTVGVLPHPPFVFRSDIAAGGGFAALPQSLLTAASRPVVSPIPQRIELFRAPAGSVAGAEPRIVLRIVSPAGVEDKEGEERLQIEVLDNLRRLFARLPDGRYRIYQIEPDGIERLVVDVIVREGHAIDAADELDSVPQGQDEPRQPSEPPAAPIEPNASIERAGELMNVVADHPLVELDTPGKGVDEAASRASEISAAVAGGYLIYAAPARRKLREARNGRTDEERALSKARRWLARKS